MEVGEAEEAAVDEKEQKTVEKKEAEVDKNSRGEIFYVDLNAYAGSDKADDGLGHTVDADGLVGESVLKEADGGSGKGAGDGVAARDCEEDGNDQGQVEDCQTGKGPGKQGLQQNRRERHQNRDGRGEAMLLEFAAGCIAAGGHIGTVVSG